MAEEYVKYLDKVELLQPLQDHRITETWGPGAGAISILGKKWGKSWDEALRRIDEVGTVI